MGERSLRFTEWEETVHPTIRNGPLWQFKVYPKAMFVYDLAWFDCANLLRDERGKTVARQLIRSAGVSVPISKKGLGEAMAKITLIIYALPWAKPENLKVGIGAAAIYSLQKF